jgi:hypothetical protein
LDEYVASLHFNDRGHVEVVNAACNASATIRNNLAIGSAAFVSSAVYGALAGENQRCERSGNRDVRILANGGALIPYRFAALNGVHVLSGADASIAIVACVEETGTDL